MIHFEVTENLSEYIDYLEQEIRNHQASDTLLKNMAEDLTNMVSEVIPRWNPNLIWSGANPGLWKIVNSENISELEIVYTGFTGRKINTWWEFNKSHKRDTTDPLERDYAYYQEYGIDKYYKDIKYKARDFEGHHYLGGSLADFDEYSIEDHAEDYLRQVMKFLE